MKRALACAALGLCASACYSHSWGPDVPAPRPARSSVQAPEAIARWLADRAGAYPVLVLVFAGIAIDAAVLAAIAPEPRIVPVTITCLTLGTFLGAGNGAVFKLVPTEFPNDAGAAGGIVGAAGGLGGFFPPIFVGLLKDAEGTYTYGFVGLLVFVAVCLMLAVWLLRTAPLAEFRRIPPAGADG